MSRPGPQLAVLVYCGWMARDLPRTWWAEPVGSGATLAFLVWLLPLALALREGLPARGPAPRRIWLALAATFLGGLLESAGLRHLGLALALSSAFPGGGASRIHLLAAASWLPTVGWLVQHQLGLASAPARILLTLVGLGAGLIARNGRSPR